jgi:hypothetical protein
MGLKDVDHDWYVTDDHSTSSRLEDKVDTFRSGSGFTPAQHDRIPPEEV